MNWLKNLGIGKKIAGGFGVIVLIMGISSLTSYLEIEKVIEINTRVFELRTPTMMASTNLLNGVNQSLADLRGYMILGADKFKVGRKDAWESIDHNLAELDKYSQNWTNPENVKHLKEMKGVFGEFKQAQKEIEDISGTIDNTPATKILVQDAAPLATVMVTEITNIINMEAKQAATKERKALLGMMADVRGTTARSLASIRAFLLTGDKKFQDAFDVMWTKNTKRFGDLTKNSRLLTSQQKASFKKFSEARAGFKGLPPKMFEIRGGKEWNMANLWLGTKAAPRAGKIVGALKGMVTNQTKLATDDIALAEATEHELEVLILTLAAISVFVSIFIGFFVVRMVTKPVESAASGLKQIAEGDLTQRYEVNSNDELGNMLGDMNQMADSLTEIVTEVVNGTTAISEAASEVSRGNADLSQRTEEQASSLEETASSMEEMTSTVKQNADNAAQANQLAAGARTQAEQGGEVVGKAVTAMAEINSSSKKIADIISVIDEIAFQTNLLALNAAVEAARAGEQGRGFAVVAGEVRSLAGRSAEAAKEIKDLIQDSVEKVDQGSKLVDESGKTLEEIVNSVKKVTDIVSEIAASSQEQSAGIEQVNKAIMQMDEMTQQNAALVEEAAAASESMEQQSQGLLQQISFFTVSGSNSQRSSRPVASQSTSQAAPAERRGSNRAFSEPQVANESPAPQMKKTGTDDWSEF